MLRKLFFLLVTLLIALPALADVGHSMGLPAKPPVIVKVGFFLDDILSIHDANETVHFVGTFSLQWQDPRLAHQQSRSLRFNDLKAASELKQIWNPHITILNARGTPEKILQYLTIAPDGTVTYRAKVRGVFESHFDLRRFPFDHQSVSFELEPFMYPSHEIQLVDWPHFDGISQRAHLPEWVVESTSATVKNAQSANGHAVSRYIFTMNFSREYLYYIWQVLVPVILIVLLSFSVFWMLDNPLVNRVAISLTAVLTIVVFEWRIYERLPHVAYHTYIDVFMTYSFIIAGLTIPVSLVVQQQAEHHRDRLVRRLRWLFPVVYLVGVGVILTVFELLG